MDQFELTAEKREDVGKGASRRLRHAGKVPGIVYGTKKDATMITLPHNEVMHHLDHEAFYSHILTLKIGKDSEKVVLKDLQRHPYKRSVLHIDLLRIDENETLTMRVPLHFINEEKCVGVKDGGGVISHQMTHIDIVCLPMDLPEFIEVDMGELKAGENVHLSDLKLPKGVESVALNHGPDHDLLVSAINIPRGSTDDDEGEAGEEAGETGETGEEAGEE